MANVRAKFFRDGEFDRVEISIVGDPSTFITKVRPEDIERFPKEWDAYRAGEKEIDYGGTPLTEVPGIEANLATAYKLKGVHNAEMLAELSDGAARALGMGAITNRKAAQLLIKANELEAIKRVVESEEAAPVRRRAPRIKSADIESAPLQ